MPVTISAEAAPVWVVERLRGLAGTRWVGIDGFGAAGKSTFAQVLAQVLPGAVIVPVDDFARPDLSGWDRDRFVAQVLRPLLAGEPARYQRWDFAVDRGVDWLDLAPGRPVIVEGVASTDVRVGVPWDVTLWLELPAEIRWQRVLERDPAELIERWQTDWIPSEQGYAAQQRPWERVDAVVVAEPSAYGSRPSVD